MTMKMTRKILILLITITFIALSFDISAFAGRANVSLTSKKNNVESQIKDVKKKINQKDKEEKSVIEQITSIEKKLEIAQSKLAQNKLRLLKAQNDLKKTQRRLELTEAELARRHELLAKRVVDIYQGENLTFANVVLQSEDMWTFLTRSHYLQEILKSDTELINRIIADKQQIEADRKKQEENVVLINSIQEDLQNERDQVISLVKAKRDQLNEISRSKELYEKALDELLAESARIENEIRRIQGSTSSAGRYNKEFSGGLIWPVYGRITSPFGYRVHPITKVYKLHTGVDIAARTGTPIRAAADGKVIMASWMNAYGYTVVIDHGSGISTLYAHCSSINARVGQIVEQGEIIAKVGSTGYSTGPHLHFEKRINGKPVNPM